MHLKNISSDPDIFGFLGAEVAPGDYLEVSDMFDERDLWVEAREKIEAGKYVVSLDKIHDFSKEQSLSYVEIYTLDKTQYRIFQKVYAHSRDTNLSDLNWETQINDGISFEETYRFGRRLRREGYWYNGGNVDQSEPIIRINYDYKFSSTGFVEAIARRISFYQLDGTLNEHKTGIETFSQAKMSKETIDRRQSIYSGLIQKANEVLTGVGQPESVVIAVSDGFSEALNDEIRLYVNHGVTRLITTLSQSVEDIETQLGMPGQLAFLLLPVDGTEETFKDYCVRSLDYRTVEAGMDSAALATYYAGSNL